MRRRRSIRLAKRKDAYKNRYEESMGIEGAARDNSTTCSTSRGVE